jgi:hypothetical protein
MDASGQINQHIFRDGGGVCPKTSILVIPKPGLSARNLLSLNSGTADSSRETAALRNDKSFNFKLHPSDGQTEICNLKSKI